MGGGENPTYSLIFSKMFLFLYRYTLRLSDFNRELSRLQEFVSLQQQLASEDQLLHLIENGEPRKKKGQRGDVAKARDEL